MKQTFEEIIYPITSEQFKDDIYTKKGILIEGENTKFDGLFSYKDLNLLLNTSPIPHPTLKLIKEVRPLPVTGLNSIIEGCRDGASLIVDEIENYNHSIATLTKLFSQTFGEYTRVNMYLGQPGVKGFNNHYDTHDVFIFQTEGFKRWRVYEPTINFPIFNLKYHGKDSPKIPYIDCVLSPGDLLYIPSGHWHEAVATEEASMHLTLGIYIKTGIDFLTWVVDELRDTEIFRKPLPLLYPNERISDKQVQEEHINELKKLVVSKLQDISLLERFKVHNIATENKYEPFNLPFQFLKDEISFKENYKIFRDINQNYIIQQSQETGLFELIILSKIITFKSNTLDFVKFILQRQETLISEIRADNFNLSIGQIYKILDILVKENVVKII